MPSVAVGPQSFQRQGAALAIAVCLLTSLARGQDDLADVNDKAHRVPGNSKLLYVEIESNPPAPEPADGFKLLLVLPGGDGSREFTPFVKRIYKYALTPEYVVVQLVAPQWPRSEMIVWPTAKDGAAAAKIATEKFIAGAVEDVASRRKIDRRHVFALGWSSGGPPVYAAALAKDSILSACMPAMSVFQPSRLPPLDRAKGHAFFVLHSPQDQVCPYRMAEAARDALAKAGATVELVDYEGGHGWQGDVFGNIRRGIAWMEEQTSAR